MTLRCSLPFALLLAATTLPLAAQTPPAAEPAPQAIQLNPRAALPITPEERKNIEELLRASGAIDLSKQMVRLFAGQVAGTLKSSRPNLPAHVGDIINQEIVKVVTEALDQPEGLNDMMAQLYHKYYTDDDIQQLIAFYRSPAGRKMVQVMPVLLPESQNLGRIWGAKLLPVVLQRVQARLKEEAGADAPANGAPQASATPSPQRRLEIAVGPRPMYPAGSRADREEGNVQLKVLVIRSGQVQSVEVLKSSGYPRLDAAAVQSVRAMSYKPFAADDERAAVATEVSVAFKLGDRQPRARSASRDI